jgi:hypothetical protein
LELARWCTADIPRALTVSLGHLTRGVISSDPFL